MLNETRSLFVIRRYRSIVFATIIVEAVNYIVSLTDSIVAGNLVNSSALAAIGLISPIISLATFLASIINSGTMFNYSYNIGIFDKKRALQFFSQGIYMALIIGTFWWGVLLMLRGVILPLLSPSAEIQQYLRDYYNIILLFFLLSPLSALLDNITVVDGGEKLSAVANVVQIVLNVLLSIFMAKHWGVKGIAAASVLCKLLFILMMLLHFFGKRNTVRLVKHWKTADCFTIARSGIVKASAFALDGLAVLAINMFVTRYFGRDTLVLVVMIEKYLGLLTMFIGMSMSGQSLISTFKGEKNAKAMRHLMRTACSYLAVTGLVLMVLTLFFAPFLATAFGITAEPVHRHGYMALRLVSMTLPLQAMLLLFFIYYYLLGKQLLAFSICLFKYYIGPVGLVILFSLITRSPVGMWVGFTAAPVLSVLICSLLVYLKGRKDGEDFPFLLRRDMDDRTFIYDFEINEDNTVAMSQTADAVIESFSIPEKTQVFAGLMVEEMLLRIRDENPGKRVFAECTIMVEEEGVRLILRDSGKIFDITDTDTLPDSFREYVVANLMIAAQEYKSYITTTGYNRNELFFPR